jgi:hypothetical protein
LAVLAVLVALFARSSWPPAGLGSGQSAGLGTFR